MNKTKFVSVDDTQKEKKETVFTHYLDDCKGWTIDATKPDSYDKVIYLGCCGKDGDMFACITESNYIHIYKGIKGDEFQKN